MYDIMLHMTKLNPTAKLTPEDIKLKHAYEQALADLRPIRQQWLARVEILNERAGINNDKIDAYIKGLDPTYLRNTPKDKVYLNACKDLNIPITPTMFGRYMVWQGYRETTRKQVGPRGKPLARHWV